MKYIAELTALLIVFITIIVILLPIYRVDLLYPIKWCLRERVRRYQCELNAIIKRTKNSAATEPLFSCDWCPSKIKCDLEGLCGATLSYPFDEWKVIKK